MSVREYAIPFILALLVHACAGAALWAGWKPDRSKPQLVQLNAVQAQLIQLEAKRPSKKNKEKPKEAKPKPRKIEVVKPRSEVKSEPEKTLPKPDSEKTQADAKARLEQQRKQKEELLKQKRLDTLVSDSFDVALAEESDALAESEDEQIAQSFAQGIQQLIKANWSRPPSARNGMQAKLLVELIPTGAVVSVSVVESSGNEAFDRSAEAAVKKAGKFDVPKDSAIFEKNFRHMYLSFKPEDLLR